MRPLKVLIACEFSGRVRDAFIAAGHNAMSCDLLPSETPGPHIQADVLTVLDCGWDIMIAHPPCTHLAISGARWFADKPYEQAEALAFVKLLLDAPIPRIALENPVSIISTAIRKPDQIIQPWMFGHGETKATCLWLKGLPPLAPTDVVDGRANVVHRMTPGPDRWRNRSRTYPGIARAMAEQWGRDLTDYSDSVARPTRHRQKPVLSFTGYRHIGDPIPLPKGPPPMAAKPRNGATAPKPSTDPFSTLTYAVAPDTGKKTKEPLPVPDSVRKLATVLAGTPAGILVDTTGWSDEQNKLFTDTLRSNRATLFPANRLRITAVSLGEGKPGLKLTLGALGERKAAAKA